MSSVPDNLDPKEATEAKLCAYLENELPPEERAEIEKYLENNPQHRQLLGDLGRTRDFVRSLPRARAPVEIGEAFQDRLERSLLLDGASEGRPIRRINRWPQLMMAAAMVVLAVGLGVVIYFVLPGHGSGPTKFSSVTPAAMPASGPVGSVEGLTREPVAVMSKTAPTDEAGHGDRLKVAIAPQPTASPAAPLPAPVAVASTPSDQAERLRYSRAGTEREVLKSGAFNGGVNNTAENGPGIVNGINAGTPAIPPAAALYDGASAVSLIDTKAVNERLARSTATLRKLGADQNNTLYVVVCTDNPNAAASQVRDYFTSNRIAYQPLPTDGTLVASGQRISNGSGIPLGVPTVAKGMYDRRREMSKDSATFKKAGDDAKAENTESTSEVSGRAGGGIGGRSPDAKYQDYAQKISPNAQQPQATQSQAEQIPGAPQRQETANLQANAPAQDELQKQPANAGQNVNQLQTVNAQQRLSNSANSNSGLNDNAVASNSGQTVNSTVSGTIAAPTGQEANNAAGAAQQTVDQQQPRAPAANTAEVANLEAWANGEASDAWYAPGLTRRAAEQLGATLSTQRLGQMAALLPNDASANRNRSFGGGGGGGAGGAGFGVMSTADTPTTAPASAFVFGSQAPSPTLPPATAPATPVDREAGLIRNDDRLTVTVAQLVGPGVDKTNTVRVAGDGTISLPMIEAVHAVGQAPKELEKEIADKYREANLIPQATVTVNLAPAEMPSTQPLAQAAPEPSTQPTAGELFAAAKKADTATQPVEEKHVFEANTAAVAQPAISLAPVTQPAMDVERVNVVVLLQRNPIGATPDAAAATQPASAAPTTAPQSQ